MSRKKILSVVLAICMVLVLLAVGVFAAETKHTCEYVNGFCTVCDGYESPVLNGDVYEISNAGQLYWFADQVNAGKVSIHGKLLENIVVNEDVLTAEGGLNGDGSNFRVWTPIGKIRKNYSGIFDGNEKTVSGLYFNDTAQNDVGLFGYVGAEGMVRNVEVTGSYLCANYRVAGIAGNNEGTVTECYNSSFISGQSDVGGIAADNEGTVTKCYNTGTIISSGESIGCAGGIVGDNYGTVTECFNTGSVSGQSDVGGIVGYNNKTVSDCYNTGSITGQERTGGISGRGNGRIFNCYNTGAVRAEEDVGAIAGFNGDSVGNCYYLLGCAVDGTGTVQFAVGNSKAGKTTADIAGSAMAVDEQMLASGEVAYKLQRWQSGQIWGQRIGTDLLPQFGLTKVYQYCDGVSVIGYSNDEMESPHIIENGFCICGCESPVLNGDVYEISNAGQLYWFAARVNGGYNDINGKLMTNIVINENVLNADGSLNGDGSNFRSWTPIGNSKNRYIGHFDGNFKTVSGLYFNDDDANNVGLFGAVGSGGCVENVGVVCSYLKGDRYVGGVVGDNYYGSVVGCYHTGSLFGGYYVGGVAGDSYYGTIHSCYNTGSVSGDYHVGGVAGEIGRLINNCYNTGNVSGGSDVGGVAGYSSGLVSNCYNTGSVSASSYIGAVVGYDTGAVRNCYYLSGCAVNKSGVSQCGRGQNHAGNSDVAGVVMEVTAQQLASGEIAWLLQGQQSQHIWGQRIGTDALPQIGQMRVYQDCDGAAVNGYSNDKLQAIHRYENGLCICGAFESAVLNGNVYEIYNAGQLYWFAAQVNGGNHAINGKLMANIVVNENVVNADGTLNGDGSNFRVWIPIGHCYYQYAGHFDGNGMTVSGLYYSSDNSGDTAIGLFGYITGTVERLGVVSSYLYGDDACGGIVGNNYGTIKNCYNTASIGGSGTDIGGIAGYSYKTVERCSNSGKISGKYNVGGVVGDNAGTLTNCSNSGAVVGYTEVGGIAGYSHRTVSGCYNTGRVCGTWRYVGGIVGENNLGSISNCGNTGNVSAESAVGGVVGLFKASGRSDLISNCYNTGTVRGYEAVGGVVGFSGKEYDDIRPSSDAATDDENKSHIINCYYLSGCAGIKDIFEDELEDELEDDPEDDLDDGLEDDLDEFEEIPPIRSSRYAVQYGIGLADYDLEGCTMGMTAEQFASGEAAYLLQAEQTQQVWGQSIGVDAVPVPGGAAVDFVDGSYYNPCAHNWIGATCTTPRHCTLCDLTADEALGHSYANGFCIRCDGYESAVLNGDVYEISNTGQLYWFAEQVNSGNNAINGKLMKNIVVNENVLTADGSLNGDGLNFRVWTPIGNNDTSFCGTFDGNSKTISGLYINDSRMSYVGLFGMAGLDDEKSAEIKSVGVVDTYFYGQEYVGGIVGKSDAKVEYCFNAGTICNRNYYLGGVVGFNDEGSICNCYNSGRIIGHAEYSEYIGGIVGDTGYKAILRDCYNTGKVSGAMYIGGVAGELSFDTINYCYNTGEISGTKYVGGVVGSISNKGILNNCYNTGRVNAVEYIGGVVGFTYNYVIVDSCYNTGIISGSYYVGGVVGHMHDMTKAVTNCYYLIGCAVDGNGFAQAGIGEYSGSGAIADEADCTTGMNAEQFASGEVAYLLQSAQTREVWGQKIGAEAAPILGGTKVYQNQIGGCAESNYVFDYTNETKDAVVTHSWIDSTCVAPKACAGCGITEGAVTGAHSYQGQMIDSGYITYTCYLCGDSYTALDSTTCEHMFVDGFCSVCGNPDPATCTHIYEAVVTAPTCTESGYTEHTCSICGDFYITDVIAAYGHTWTASDYEWKYVDYKFTCTAYGICACGATTEVTLEQSAITYEVLEPATCRSLAVYLYTAHFTESWTEVQICRERDEYGFWDSSNHTGGLSGYRDSGNGKDCVQYWSCCGRPAYTPHEFTVLEYYYEANCFSVSHSCYSCERCGAKSDWIHGEEIDPDNHEYTYIVDNGDGTHRIMCDSCENVVIEPAVPHSTETWDFVSLPTCTEGGYTTRYGCCYSYIIDRVPALGHSWVYTYTENVSHSFTCTTCGETVTIAASDSKKFAINSAAPVLSDDIVMKYRTTVPAGFEDGYMSFEFNGETYEVYDFELDGDQLAFEFPYINPQKMGDNICATLVATVDGVQVSIEIAQYSMLKNCDNQLRKTNLDAKTRTMLSDVVIYGALAQISTNYKTDMPITSLLSADAVLTPSSFPEELDATLNVMKRTGQLDARIQFTGVTLSLGSKMAIRVAVTCTDTSLFTYKVEVSGREYTYTGEDLVPVTDGSDGKYYLFFNQMKATEFGNKVTFTGWEGDTQVGYTIEYSVYTFIYRNFNKVDTNTQELLKAIYNYGESVK